MDVILVFLMAKMQASNGIEYIKIFEKYGCNNVMYIIDVMNSWKANELPTYKKE